MKPGLQALLGGSKRVETFFETAWPHEPFVVHGALSRLAGLADVAELKNVESMCEVQCHSLLAQSQSLGAHRFGNVAVDATLAPTLLESGVTLYFNEPQWRSRSLWKWMAALEKELSLSAGMIHPSAFFSSPGRGARMHFDCTESFVVQVRGSKTWTIARNDELPWPSVNYLEGEPLPEAFRGLVRRPMKAPPAKKRTSVELRPGSVMYLPRGWWHSTTTREASVHLDLLAALPTWGDAARVVVERVLATAPWRATMTAGDASMGEQLIEDLTQALNLPMGATSRALRARNVRRRTRPTVVARDAR